VLSYQPVAAVDMHIDTDSDSDIGFDVGIGFDVE